MNTIANNIRILRTGKNMTQAQLAAALGVQFQTVSKWERGTTLPDTAMLPEIADRLGVTIDALFGRETGGCGGEMPKEETEFLLHTYSQMYGPEAGPWNLSVENRYLEYRFAAFFEENFTVSEGADLCNIGIGAGEWDRYLSYRLRGGSLTSIDRLENCCRQLEARLRLEGNPNAVRVEWADAMALDHREEFDLVTMVGTTGLESGGAGALLEKACSFVKKGGALYYQTLDGQEDCDSTLRIVFQCGMRLTAMHQDMAYSFTAYYYKFEKR